VTDIKLLKNAIKKSGYRLRYIAEQLGISYQGLCNKINGIYDFKADEILVLCNLLHISMQEKEVIFLLRK
jgi:hypothetical protein